MSSACAPTYRCDFIAGTAPLAGSCLEYELRDVIDLLPGERRLVRLHDAFALRDDVLDRRARSLRLVEVRPGHARRAGRLHHVTGAAPGREEDLLAGRHVLDRECPLHPLARVAVDRRAVRVGAGLAERDGELRALPRLQDAGLLAVDLEVVILLATVLDRERDLADCGRLLRERERVVLRRHGDAHVAGAGLPA